MKVMKAAFGKEAFRFLYYFHLDKVLNYVFIFQVYDMWHPMDKAKYPEFFARRELNKRKFIKWWDKTYMEEAQNKLTEKS